MRMIRSIKLFSLLLVIAQVVIGTMPVKAQCAMCSATADAGMKNGNTQSRGLNDGVMYLLAAPYLAAAAVGFIWYKKYRRKNVELNMRNKDFHLN